MVKDCDGNEIKVGDTVEVVDGSGSGLASVGRRHAVRDFGPVCASPDHCLVYTDGPAMRGFRFRKVAQTKPVYPFKVGDVVECLNADSTLDPILRVSYLREGGAYRVLAVRRDIEGDGTHTDLVQIGIGGRVRWCLAVRFCAPGESRASLRKELESLKRDLLQDPAQFREALSKAQARITELQELMIEQLRDLDAVSSRRDRYKARCEKLQEEVSHLKKINEALAAEADVRSAGVTKGGYVVLTKAAQ